MTYVEMPVRNTTIRTLVHNSDLWVTVHDLAKKVGITHNRMSYVIREMLEDKLNYPDMKYERVPCDNRPSQSDKAIPYNAIEYIAEKYSNKFTHLQIEVDVVEWIGDNKEDNIIEIFKGVGSGAVVLTVEGNDIVLSEQELENLIFGLEVARRY